jgi:hypothetical protein
MRMGIYGNLMVRTFSTPIVERFQTRIRRRILTVLKLANCLGIAAICWFWPSAWWVLGPLFMLEFLTASLLNMSVRGITEIPLNHLDDRQAQQRMKAFHDSYRIGVPVAVLTGIGLVRMFSTDGIVAPFLFLGAIAGGVSIIPAMLLAWRLPDESDEEDVY